VNDIELDKIELELLKEFDAVVPDCFDQIMAKCEAEGLFSDDVSANETEEVTEVAAIVSEENTVNEVFEETIKDETDESTNIVDIATAKRIKKHKVAQFISIAASLVLTLGGTAVGYAAYQTPSETIQLDVNPSIEMTVNAFGRVLSCEPNNSDADPIVGKFNLKDKKYTYALEKITDAIIDAGYISEEKNTVLVSVIGRNEGRIAKVSDRASMIIDSTILSSGIDPCVMYQCTNSVSGVENFAKSAGVSEGKAIAAKRLSSVIGNGSVYNVSKLSVNELGILLNEYSAISPKISFIGQPNRNGYLTKANAISLAESEWSALGITNDTVKAALTVDENGLVYVVSGANGGNQNNLLVVAKNESYSQNVITKVITDTVNPTNENTGSNLTGNIGQNIVSGVVPTPPAASAATDTDISGTTYISEKQAADIAVNFIGGDAKVKHVTRVDRNDKPLYKVKVEAFGTEQHVYVDAITGAVVGLEI